MCRVVVVLACVLACLAAIGTAQDANAASKHQLNPSLDAKVSVAAAAAAGQQSAAVQPVTDPTAALTAANRTADLLEVESMISGDISEDGSSTTPDVESMGGAGTVVAQHPADGHVATASTVATTDTSSNKLPKTPVTVSVSSKKPPGSSKQGAKSGKRKAEKEEEQQEDEGHQQQQQHEGASDDDRGGGSSSDHDVETDTDGGGSSPGTTHKAGKGSKGKHKQVASESSAVNQHTTPCTCAHWRMCPFFAPQFAANAVCTLLVLSGAVGVLAPTAVYPSAAVVLTLVCRWCLCTRAQAGPQGGGCAGCCPACLAVARH